jgi:hypothetical protein
MEVKTGGIKMKNEEITTKQKEYIELIHKVDSIPRFKGTTKKEASLYIAKYGSKISVNSWTIKRGY